MARLKRLDLISAGAVVDSKGFVPSTQVARLDFSLVTQRSSWYAVVVEDIRGRKAYSDPIWIDVIDGSGLSSPGLGTPQQ